MKYRSSASKMLFRGLFRGDRRRVSRTPEPKDGRKQNRRASSVGADGGTVPQKSKGEICAVQSTQWGDRTVGAVSRGDSMSTCSSSRFSSGTFPAEISEAALDNGEACEMTSSSSHDTPVLRIISNNQGEFCGEDDSEKTVDVRPEVTSPASSAVLTPRLISSCISGHVDFKGNNNNSNNNNTGKDSEMHPADGASPLDAIGRSSRKRSSGAFIQPLSGDSAESFLSSSTATEGVEDSRSLECSSNHRTKTTQPRTALLLPIPCRRFGAPPPQPPAFSVHQHSRHRSLPTGSCRSRPIVKHVSFHSPLVVQVFEDATADSQSAASSGTVRSPSSISDTAADSAVAAAAVAAAEVCAEGWFPGPRRNSFSYSDSSSPPAEHQDEPMPLFRELQHRLQLEKHQGDYQTKHPQLLPQFGFVESQRHTEDTPSAPLHHRLQKEALFVPLVEADENSLSGCSSGGSAGSGSLSSFLESDSGAMTGRHSSRRGKGTMESISFDACPPSNETAGVISEAAAASPGGLPKVAPLLY